MKAVSCPSPPSSLLLFFFFFSLLHVVIPPFLSPPELYNHGFENMESLGAVYSRISSHVFGDWNACGKVMGLSPYGKMTRGKKDKGGEDGLPSLMRGDLLKEEGEGGFVVEWDVLEGLPGPNEWREEDQPTFDRYAQAADRVQRDLEEVVLNFLNQVRVLTGSKNLCLVGGVALNSVMNGRILRESGFDEVFIPPYPGDEGVCVGCAVYGLHTLSR